MSPRLMRLALASIVSALALGGTSERKPLRNNTLREVSLSPVAHVKGARDYSPTLSPGNYGWTEHKVVVSPIGRGGAIVADYGRCALVANLHREEDAAKVPFNEHRPQSFYWIRPGEAESVWWDPQRRCLGLRDGDVSRVAVYDTFLGHAIEVPFHSAYIGAFDMISYGFAGCTALALQKGDKLVFCHLLGKGYLQTNPDDHDSLNVQNVFPRLDRAVRQWEGWKAYIAAGGPGDLDELKRGCRERGIPVVEARLIGGAGHAVHFNRATSRLNILKAVERAAPNGSAPPPEPTLDTDL